MIHFDYDDAAFSHRSGSTVLLTADKNVHITTDILASNNGNPTPNVSLNSVEESVNVLAKQINIASYSSKISGDTTYSVVYGERLVEILKWIIEVLKTHSHGPNSPAVPTFHPEANKYIDNMTEYLLNENVRTK